MSAERSLKIAQVVGRRQIAADCVLLRLESENLGIGCSVGRFAMLHRPDGEDILPRPYSFCQMHSSSQVSFLIKGFGPTSTQLMNAPIGSSIAVLGPLGQGFPQVVGPVWAVAGGVGVAPFGLLPPQADSKLLLGIKHREEVGYASVTTATNCEISSDDGSIGIQGTVIDLLQACWQRQDKVTPAALFSCGPQAMMQRVSTLAQNWQVPCFVAVEERMACGIGICRGCVWPTPQNQTTCLCVDGPVYAAAAIFS